MSISSTAKWWIARPPKTAACDNYPQRRFQPGLLRAIEVPGRADGAGLAVVRVSARHVLCERHEDVGRACGERQSCSRVPVVHAPQPVALRESFRRVELTREQKRDSCRRSDAQPAVRSLPVRIAANVQPARKGIAEFE